MALTHERCYFFGSPAERVAATTPSKSVSLRWRSRRSSFFIDKKRNQRPITTDFFIDQHYYSLATITHDCPRPGRRISAAHRPFAFLAQKTNFRPRDPLVFARRQTNSKVRRTLVTECWPAPWRSDGSTGELIRSSTCGAPLTRPPSSSNAYALLAYCGTIIVISRTLSVLIHR